MKVRKLLQLTGVLALGLASPLWAKHGLLATTDRDAWINAGIQTLVDGGLVDKPSRPLGELTNLEVVQLTAQAAHMVLAQADILPSLDAAPPALPGDLALPPPAASPQAMPAPGLPGETPVVNNFPAGKSLKELTDEFKDEISAMDLDLTKLEDKIYEQQHRNDKFSTLQQKYLKATGTVPYGDSKGFFNLYRGFGPNAVYNNMDYNDFMFLDFGFKAVPVPFLLFDVKLRITRTIGLYYVDPITPPMVLRSITLSNVNDVATFSAGDFYKSYTRLTLWNYNVPVYTFIEPTSFERNRKAVEELVYMDHGNDWHLRGLQGEADWANQGLLSRFKVQAMAGELKSATQATFSDYYASTQASIRFFNDNLELKGVGLLLWDDPNSATVPYLPDFASTFAKQYQIGSLSAGVTVPFDKNVNLAGSLEGAFSYYQDDSNNAQRFFQDWAVLGDASINVQGVHLKAKYMNIGPYFYSPGAQTNRYSVVPGGQGYLATNLFLDDALPGYLDNYVFQQAGRPSFAAYDRLAENMLPYGDATPNRLGMIGGLTIDLGEKGWLEANASYVPPLSSLQMHEIQPDYVLNPAGLGAIAVDAAINTATVRTFGGYEGALTIDFAKAFDLKNRTYQVSFDYKNQTTDLGIGAAPFTVNTLIAAVDFNPPLKGFDSVVFSVGYENIQASGSEYVLTGQGSPSSYANYPFYLDNGNQSSVTFASPYTYMPLDITKTVWAFGMQYPLSPTILVRGDLFLNQYTWADSPVPGFGRQDLIWRLAYEASF